jgi:6-phosphogluconolactonase
MAQAILIPGVDDAGIAAWLHARLESALGARAGAVAIALPGGSTPFPILEKLVQMPLEWERLEIWPTDDRVVPEDHEASNAGRIRALLEPAGAKVVALEESARPPHFALVWLGMGTDGHIASLFPNTDPQIRDPQRVRRITPDPLPSEAPFDRTSLTIPALLASRELVFVIRGEAKSGLFEEALARENDLPVARLLGAAAQSVTCFT